MSSATTDTVKYFGVLASMLGIMWLASRPRRLVRK